jgi:hypothetical protein
MSDWGQGAKNNNIGWGQGAVNNDISWGSIHEDSWSGDTDIVGLDPIETIINAFEERVSLDGGTFEAESCLNTTLTDLNNDGLLEEASLVITPNAVEEGKLFSIKPTDGSGDLSVVRATTKTRVNSLGVIESVPINVAALDYTNSTCPSILVEPQRTNLVFPSATATTQSRTVTATAHTLSFYGTGSVVLSGVAIATLNGTDANDRVTLTFTPTAGTLILTIVGSVINWQLEPGANATSYIQTVASAVTRNADVISKTGIYTNELISEIGGTWFLDLSNNIPTSRAAGSTSSIFLNTTTSATLGNGFTIRNVAGGIIRLQIVKIVNGIATTLYLTQDNNVKIAIKWNGLTADIFENGVKVISSTTFTSTDMENMVVDGTPRIISVKSISIFPSPLSDQECINLTTL